MTLPITHAFILKGSITNLDDSYSCSDGSTRLQKQKRIWGVLGAASSATSIQVANLLRLFRIPQVSEWLTLFFFIIMKIL